MTVLVVGFVLWQAAAWWLADRTGYSMASQNAAFATAVGCVGLLYRIAT